MPDQRKEPESIIPRAEHEIGKFIFHLLATIQDMDELDQTLTPEQQQLAQTVKDDLIALDNSAKYVTKLLFEMGDLIKLLVFQRQSTKEAFLAGWEGFYRDLLSHLNAEERAQLQPILDGIIGDELPY
jgi:hypothetical protein